MNVKEKLRRMKELAAANEQHVQEWKAREAEEMAGKITGVLVDVTKRTIKKVTIEKSLDGYYAALNCRCIDIVSRTIGGMPFLIVCDDEGLLKSDMCVSAIAPSGETMLVGNLFIVKSDGTDDIESLTDNECQHIMRNQLEVRKFPSLMPYPIICNCWY